MSDVRSAIAPAEPLLYRATLVRGRFYSLRDKIFLKGVGVPITRSERDHLAEHAVERILDPAFDPHGDELMEDAILAIGAFEFEDLESPDADVPHPDHEPPDPSEVR